MLHQRINTRVDQMYDAGLVDEVRQLLVQYKSLSRTASQAVGYREIIEAIGANRDPVATKELVATHTRQMVRRQETWLRSFSEIRAIDVCEPIDAHQVAQQITEMLV